MKLIIFDIDGTLLDTTEYIYRAFEHSLKQHGYPVLSREDMSHTIGEPLDYCYQTFSGDDEVAHLVAAHHAHQVNHPELAHPYAQAIATLQKLKDAKYHIGALTSRAGNTAHDTLDQAGISKYIDYVLALEDVNKPKPDPEGIHQHLHYFGVDALDSIMVGDSPVDILAGKNAGIDTVGVTYGFHGERIIESDPTHVIDDIGEIVRLAASS